MKQSSSSLYKMLFNKTFIQTLQKSAFIKNNMYVVNEFVRIYFFYIIYELFISAYCTVRYSSEKLVRMAWF